MVPKSGDVIYGYSDLNPAGADQIFWSCEESKCFSRGQIIYPNFKGTIENIEPIEQPPCQHKGSHDRDTGKWECCFCYIRLKEPAWEPQS